MDHAAADSFGQASDIISLTEPLSDEDAEVLRFFKQKTTGLNNLSGDEAVEQLLSNPDNSKAWESRPPTPIQKHFYLFVGLPQPKGLNATEMAKHIRESCESLKESVEEEWQAFDDAFEEITSREFRDDNEVKKASFSHFREAYESLRAEGQTLSDELTVYDIADRIEEQHPGFQK